MFTFIYAIVSSMDFSRTGDFFNMSPLVRRKVYKSIIAQIVFLQHI